MNGTVELSTVISFAASFLTLAMTAYVAIAKYAVAQREAALDRRIDEIEESITKVGNAAASEVKDASKLAKEYAERLHMTELSVVKLQGELAMARSTAESLDSDFEEIKLKMVARSEWEPQMKNYERTLNNLMLEVRGGSRYSSSSGLVVSPKKT